MRYIALTFLTILLAQSTYDSGSLLWVPDTVVIVVFMEPHSLNALVKNFFNSSPLDAVLRECEIGK
jgi:hypothetical protein